MSTHLNPARPEADRVNRIERIDYAIGILANLTLLGLAVWYALNPQSPTESTQNLLIVTAVIGFGVLSALHKIAGHLREIAEGRRP